MRSLYRLFALGLALLAAGPAAFAQPTLPDALDGKFRGTLSGNGGEVDGAFTVTIRKSDGGFSVIWPPRIVARFEPAGRPGVFKTTKDLHILDGEPVYWARVVDQILIIYSAQIDEHGGYHIDNFTYVPAADGLELEVRQVVPGAAPKISSGKLTRYGH
jgi:hypothetical protein